MTKYERGVRDGREQSHDRKIQQQDKEVHTRLQAGAGHDTYPYAALYCVALRNRHGAYQRKFAECSAKQRASANHDHGPARGYHNRRHRPLGRFNLFAIWHVRYPGNAIHTEYSSRRRGLSGRGNALRHNKRGAGCKGEDGAVHCDTRHAGRGGLDHKDSRRRQLTDHNPHRLQGFQPW